MTLLDGDDDPLDPVLAERFLLLDRLTPPADVRRTAPTSPPVARLDHHRSRRPMLWLAAAAVVLAVASAGFLLDRGTTGVDTIDPATGPAGASDDGDDASTRADDGEPVRVAVDADGDDGADGAGDGPADDGVTTGSTDPTDGTDTTGDDPSSTPSTGSSSPAGTASGPTTSAVAATTGPAGPTTATTAASSPSTPATSASTASSSTSISLVPGKDTRITLHGIVTEVFTDCVAHLVLEDGRVVSRSPVSCDGGSWIVVEGTRVVTSSGFVAGDQEFDRHDPDLRPGTRVNVNAMVPAGSTVPTLDCPGCGIRGG